MIKVLLPDFENYRLRILFADNQVSVWIENNAFYCSSPKYSKIAIQIVKLYI